MNRLGLHIHVILLLLPLQFASPVAAQSGPMPRVKKTLGSNEYMNIHCGLADRTGNLWFGATGEGVYRFDGKQFIQFTTRDGLADNTVWCMAEDKAGILWIGTEGGLSRFDGKRMSRIPITPVLGRRDPLSGIPEPSSITGSGVWSILPDSRGRLWVGTRDGLYRYDGTAFTRFPDAATANPSGVHLKMIDDMLEDRDGNFWFASGMPPGGEGICLYDGRSLTRFKPLGDGWIRTVLEAPDGTIYLATRLHGVCRYDPATGGFVNISKAGGIADGSVTTILADRKGRLWMGTELGSGERGEDGGVWLYDGKAFTRFTTGDGLVHNGVFSIVEDDAGNLWFGTRDVGLSRFDGKAFTRFSE